MRKGIEPLLASVLFVAISIIAITIVVQIGMPAIEKLQDMAAIEQAKGVLSNLDTVIRDVAVEGLGSTRVLSLELKKGNLVVDSLNNRIYYELKTYADIISPRSRKAIGNLIIASDSNVNVRENATHIVLENEHLRVSILKNQTLEQIGNVSSNFTQSTQQQFSFGDVNENTTVTAQGVTLNITAGEYSLSGNYTSVVGDAGGPATWGALSYAATVPPETNLSFQIATDNIGNPTNFVGPDGTAGTLYASQQNIWAGHNSQRYIRFKAFFNTSDVSVSPLLKNVSINYEANVIGYTLGVLNTSRIIESLYFIDQNKYLNGTVSLNIDNDPRTETGLGTITAKEVGSNLPRGVAIAKINSTPAYYEIWLTLESGADWFAIEGKNYQRNI